MPKVKLEIAKGSYYYSGAAAYNKLPKTVKESLSLVSFVTAVKDDLCELL